MEQEETISKKELLKLTGISYGQLYRWKRERLIPESWFVKQSVITGQETFLPKDRIVKRVELIRHLKSSHTLDEMACMLSPELTDRTFKSQELRGLKDFSPTMIGTFERILEKDRFSFREILFIHILGSINIEYHFDRNDMDEMVLTVRSWLPNMKNIPYRFVLCMRYSQTFILLVGGDAPLLTNRRSKVIKEFYLDEVSKEVNLKLGGVSS